MCRLYGFHANALTRVDSALVRAQNERLTPEDPAHAEAGDGWGIAGYGDMHEATNRIPLLVEHKTRHFARPGFSTRARELEAQTVVAHVRQATVGPVNLLNAQPFTYEGWTFAHTGTIPGFADLEEGLAAECGRLQAFRLGSSDSEQLFLWLMQRLQHEGIDLDAPDPVRLRAAVLEAITMLDERVRRATPTATSQLTFLLTNGRVLVACRWHTPLYMIEHDASGPGQQGAPQHSAGYRSVQFATQPLTKDNWQLVPDETVSVVSEDVHVLTTNHLQGS